jgi:hypothetical protein
MMDHLEKAKEIAQLFITYTKQKGNDILEEIQIQSDDPNSRYRIKIHITPEHEKVIFEKLYSPAFIVVLDAQVVAVNEPEELYDIIEILDIAGMNLIRKVSRQKKRREQPYKKHKKEKTMVRIDRLLDKYNDYQKLYHTFQEEKYKKRGEKLIRLLKKIPH